MKRQTKWNWVASILVAFALSLSSLSASAAPPSQDEDPETMADRLYNEGIELSQSDQFSAALEKFEEAISLYREVGNLDGEGKCLYFVGVAKRNLADVTGALEAYEASLKIYQRMNHKPSEALVLNDMGLSYKLQGQYELALDYYKKALEIWQEIGDQQGEGKALNNIGAVYDSLGQYQQALEYYQQALVIRVKVGDQAGEGKTHNNIGLLYHHLGQYQKALDSYEEALKIAENIGDRSMEGITRNNIGLTYNELGEYQPALLNYQQALAIHQEIGDPYEEATTFNNLGLFYSDIGEYTRALEYFEQALAIQQAIDDPYKEEITLGNLGMIYLQRNEPQQALEYLTEQLAIDRELGLEEGEGAALNYLGLVLNDLGQHQQALENYQMALAIRHEIGDRAGEAGTLRNIGMTYRDIGQTTQALEHYQRALAIQQEIGDRAGESYTLSQIGFLQTQLGDNHQAITYYQKALEITESIQASLKVEELKTPYAAAQAETYDQLIALVWAEGRFEEAFNYAERARARAFLDQLASGVIDFRAGADAQLLEREQALRNEIDDLRAQRITLRDEDAILALETELETREGEYGQLLIEIKTQSPEVAGLVSVDVASLADVQARLDPNTTLIEYFVTEKRTLVFILTDNTFETTALEITQDNLEITIDNFLEFASLDDPHPASLKQLYMWLIAPLKDKIQTPVVGIIPHGKLHSVPFSALTDGTRYLSEKYTLFSLPSASSLRFIQEKRKSGANTILALGNPSTNLSDLDSAKDEVEAIARLYGTRSLKGDEATESIVRTQGGNVGVLHLAAHGEYNSENPLFGVIYLTADSQNDGRLEVHEIYGLDLTQTTDLVVLSACETNTGEPSSGDEIVGMTRAFIYAGAPTVIASLWKVDDEKTALLMERFYIHLRAGLSKGEALQKAQSDVREQYPHPYYWAAFVLTGDAGTPTQVASAPSPPISNRTWWAVGIGVSLLLGASCVVLVVILVGGIVLRRRRKRVRS